MRNVKITAVANPRLLSTPLSQEAERKAPGNDKHGQRSRHKHRQQLGHGTP
jgi:hypothetical protein